MLASRQATVAAWLYSRHLVKMRAFDFAAELKRMKEGGELPSAAVDYTVYVAVVQGGGSSECAGLGKWGCVLALVNVRPHMGVLVVSLPRAWREQRPGCALQLRCAAPACSPREIKRTCIKLITSIGSGQFGEVRVYVWHRRGDASRHAPVAGGARLSLATSLPMRGTSPLSVPVPA